MNEEDKGKLFQFSKGKKNSNFFRKIEKPTEMRNLNQNNLILMTKTFSNLTFH
jgi:hypothetical protein